MAASSNPNPPFEFSAEQDQTIGSLAFALCILGGLLLVIAVLYLVSGVLDILSRPLSGILSLAEGLLLGFMGLVMLTSAGDFRYILTTEGYDKAHLVNGVNTLNAFYRTQLILGIIVSVLLLIGLFL
jgi:hypothetical protein